MRYLRADILGLFCGELGIRSSSRIVIAPSGQGLLIWDLSSGVEFNLDFQYNTLASEQKPAPEPCHTIFNQPDGALFTRLTDPGLMPWSDERETLLSELRYRNLIGETRFRYPLRPMLLSLCAHLVSRLNPLRLFRRPSYGS